jgi:hypothetical protein
MPATDDLAAKWADAIECTYTRGWRRYLMPGTVTLILTYPQAREIVRLLRERGRGGNDDGD